MFKKKNDFYKNKNLTLIYNYKIFKKDYVELLKKKDLIGIFVYDGLIYYNYKDEIFGFEKNITKALADKIKVNFLHIIASDIPNKNNNNNETKELNIMEIDESYIFLRFMN